MVMSYTEQVRGVLSQLSQSFKEGSGQMNPQWSLYAFVNYFSTLTFCFCPLKCFSADTASHKLLVRDLKEYFWAVCRVSKWSVLLDLLTLPLAFHFAWHGNCKG